MKKTLKILAKLNFGIVGFTAIVFSAIALYVAISTQGLMEDEARHTLNGVAEAAIEKINLLMREVESATENTAWMVNDHVKDADFMYRITERLVRDNRYIVGSTVAFEPNFYAHKGLRYSPYSYKDATGKIKNFPLVYDYHNGEWYKVPKNAKKSSWCEPYLDEGGGEVWMSTYSVPITDGNGKVFAILTADVSLEGLKEYVAKIEPYEHSYAVLKSAAGKSLVLPPNDAGERGEMITEVRRADNGWTLELCGPKRAILGGANRMFARVLTFSILALAFIFAVSHYLTGKLQRATAANARIKSELSIASTIQSGLLNRDFPDYIGATLRPAKEIGGDLYDFREVGDKMYFVIGDASGKGIPAALFSFVADTGFRVATDIGMKSNEIANGINTLLTRGNDTNMFVTMFVGVLDRKTGILDYCNMGHNPPILTKPNGGSEYVQLKHNIPAGVMEEHKYVAQEVELERGSRITLYTDGITEAENAKNEQFGEWRLLETVSKFRGKSPSEVVKGIIAAADEFADGAEQFDDMTVMEIVV